MNYIMGKIEELEGKKYLMVDNYQQNKNKGKVLDKIKK